MKKVVFVGLSNKKDKEPFDKTTNSGKVIDKVINQLDYECFKLNLVPYAPTDKFGKLRYPTKEEIKSSLKNFKKEIEKIKPNCIVGLGNIVNNELKKITKYQKNLICEKHSSYIYVYKKAYLEQYITNLIDEINKRIGDIDD